MLQTKCYTYKIQATKLRNITYSLLVHFYVKCINKNEDSGTAIKILTSLGDCKDSAKIVAERCGEEE